VMKLFGLNPRPLRGLTTVAWILFAIVAFPAWLWGQTSGSSDRAPSGPSVADAPAEITPPLDEEWLSRLIGAKGGANEHSRNHVSVLTAFREVVRLAGNGTVRVLSGDKQVALGTIVDPEGWIATKGSELRDEIHCELWDGTRLPATLIGVDRGSDLALLRIPASGLSAVRWREEAPPAVGGWVVSPGLGELPQAIGIVSVAPHQVRGGVLGIQLTEDEPGPRVTFVVPESGAARAGLRSGDVITHANGRPMRSADDMVATTSALLPGETIRLNIVRANESQEISATLGSVSDTLSSQRARCPASERRFLFPSARTRFPGRWKETWGTVASESAVPLPVGTEPARWGDD
jgi:S1-C subfamily serine protease